MMEQLVTDAVGVALSGDDPPDLDRTMLIDASSLEDDEGGTLLGVKQALLDSTDAILFCETEIPGGAARFHRARSERGDGELTVICRVDGEVWVMNAGPDGIAAE
ncbi:MAG: hypothetical protein KDC38_08495 [Planctomycetes bacterium]|nr:hypothetical protein [Planctomycetota bacterium]